MRVNSRLLLCFLVIAATSCIVAVSADDQDYYDVLGLPQKDDTPEKDIKSAYRKLSKQYHPDLHGESTRETYTKIQRAYEVLSDRKKRKVYDMKGEEGLKQLEQQAAGGGAQQMDPFLRMFGFGGGNQGGATKGSDVNMMLLVKLEDIYSGASHTVRLNKQKLCKRCKGTGANSKNDFMKCKHCGGKGMIVQRIQLAPGFVQQAQQPCPHCNGKGMQVKKKCEVCLGQKVTRGEQNLEVDIERGTPENYELKYEMEADQSPDVLPGDVIFTIISEPHELFTRKGNDLLMTLKISLKEALLGYHRTFKHLDGHDFDVELAGVIKYGQELRIPEEGMPIHNVPSETGELIVTFQVELPEELTSEQRSELAAILPK